MSTAAVPLPSPPAVQRTRYRFSVEEYHKLGEFGLFAGKPRVELIEGEIFEVSPPNPLPATTGCVLTELLVKRSLTGWNVRPRLTLLLAASSLLPDVCVVAGDVWIYTTRHPNSADVGLLIEVADASSMDDRRDKGRLYAQDGVVEFWIVNIPERQIEVYTQPSGPTATPGYGQRQDYLPGASVPIVLGGIVVGSIAVNELFL